MVNEPTRGSNILDIILCNEPQTLSDIVLRLPLSNGDHQVEFIVFIEGPNSNTCNTYQTVQYDLGAADFSSIMYQISCL